jgi:hypothetical protein
MIYGSEEDDENTELQRSDGVAQVQERQRHKKSDDSMREQISVQGASAHMSNNYLANKITHMNP